MALRYKARAHTPMSGAERWSYLFGIEDEPTGKVFLEWTNEPSRARIFEGIFNDAKEFVAHPTPEEMRDWLTTWREAYESAGEVWGLEFVYLD